MTHKDKDLQRIEELIDIMKENDLVEIEIKHGDDKIMLKRSQPQQPAVTAMPIATPIAHAVSANQDAGLAKADQIAAPESKESEDLVEITSPIVGTFYATPSPDSDAYVEIGSQIEPQTVICIIEAMKVMNEIKAETSGTIAEILVTSGQAVEFGQVLFKVKPD